MKDFKTQGRYSTGNSWDGRWTEWQRQHATSTTMALLVAGLIARVWSARGTFLNPDEAQHFLVANRTSLPLAYQSSLTLAHPPLLIFVLYFWRHLGTSEFMLRLPSILLGILFCWIFFKWLTLILGQKTAFIGLIFACFLPPLVSLTSEVRQYSLLLLFMAIAAYLLEKSLIQNSLVWMLFFSISLYLALLSHYSAMLFAGSVGIYAALRIASSHLQRRVIAVWILGQLGALSLLTFLYRTHISQLRGSSMEHLAAERWLRRSYFHPGQDHFLSFVVGRTFGVFQFIFGNLAIGDIMALLFFGSLLLLLRQRNYEENAPRKPWHLLVLFLSPFVLNGATALAGVYPFGGTRHSAFMTVFCLAGISFFLATVFVNRNVRSLGAVLLIVATSCVFGRPHHPFMTRADQSREAMKLSLDFIRQHIPPDTPLFVDVQTRMLLTYYLCPQQQSSPETSVHEFLVSSCGGYEMITANVWLFETPTFHEWWSKMISAQELTHGKKVWVVQEGWDIDLGRKLKSEIKGFEDLKINSFGRNIQLFELTVK